MLLVLIAANIEADEPTAAATANTDTPVTNAERGVVGESLDNLGANYRDLRLI